MLANKLSIVTQIVVPYCAVKSLNETGIDLQMPDANEGREIVLTLLYYHRCM